MEEFGGYFEYLRIEKEIHQIYCDCIWIVFPTCSAE